MMVPGRPDRRSRNHQSIVKLVVGLTFPLISCQVEHHSTIVGDRACCRQEFQISKRYYHRDHCHQYMMIPKNQVIQEVQMNRILIPGYELTRLHKNKNLISLISVRFSFEASRFIF